MQEKLLSPQFWKLPNSCIFTFKAAAAAAEETAAQL
jgi:hypothetical protein